MVPNKTPALVPRARCWVMPRRGQAKARGGTLARSLKSRIKHPYTGLRVGTIFSPPVCLCGPWKRSACHHRRRDAVKGVAMANSTPFCKTKSSKAPRAPRKMTRNIVDCVMGLSRLSCRWQSPLARTSRWYSTPPCPPVSHPNPHDSANARSRDGRHSCRGGDIGC